MGGPRRDRLALALIVWGVLVAQVLLYPGVEDIVTALGAPGDLSASMWFLVAEFGAFVAFASVWGAISDATGRRIPLVAVGALGGAASYLALAAVPEVGASFAVVLFVRVIGGAFTIGAFSLAITMLADLSGGNGRNMGAAGIAIGLGAALGSVLGGRLATLDPLAPLYGAAALLVAVAGLTLVVPDNVPGGADASPRAVLARLARRPELGVPFAFGFIDRLTAGFFALVGVAYFRDAFGLDAFGAGLVLALFFLPFAVLQYPLGSLSDRIGRFTPVVVGSLAYGVVIVAVGLAPTLPVAAGLMVLVGVCGALVAPATMALVTDVADAGERGAALGGFNLFGSLGFLGGFLLGGVTATTLGYLDAFLVVGGTEIAIALIAARAVRRLSPGEGAGVVTVGD